MDNLTTFKNGYDFASCEKNLDDMHSKFNSLNEEISIFMLGYAFYLIEISKFLDGASSESISAKMNIGIAQECIKSVINENQLDYTKCMEISNALYEMAGETSIDDVANSIIKMI